MATRLAPLLLLTFLAVRPGPGRAELITFDFATPPGSSVGLALDGLSSGVVHVTGVDLDIAMTAVAGLPGSGDRFNHTGSPNFGINASGPGDTTDALDAGAGASEFMEVSFTTSVPAVFELAELDFDRITGAGGAGEDAGLLAIGNGIALAFNGATVDSSDRFVVGIPFAAGETLRLSHLDGNGFGLEKLVLDVRPEPATTVPEASSLTLLGLGAGLLSLRWRHWQRSGRNL